MQNYETQIQQSIALFEKLNNILDKTRIPLLNEELAKLVPTENSHILLAADMVFEPASVGFSVIMTEPSKNVPIDSIEFIEIFKIWASRNTEKKINAVKTCLSELNIDISDQWDIDFVPVYYVEKLKQTVFHFRIYDKVGYEHENKERA